jgi:hypothetical protein
MNARVLIGLIVVVTVVGGYSFKVTRRAEEAGAPRGTSTTIEKSFRLFDSTPEMLPVSVRARLSRILKKPGTPFTPSPVQRSHTNGGIVWAFVVGDQVCLTQGTHGASVCVAKDVAISEGVSLGTFSPPSQRIPRPHNFLLLGLVPDGVGRVELKIGRRRERAGVKNNLYSVSGDKPIFVRRLVRETS